MQDYNCLEPSRLTRILKDAFPSPNFQVPTLLILVHSFAVEFVHIFRSQVMFHFNTFLSAL